LGRNNFQFLPFGAGRRLCPGINYGMAAVELMLANMVHRLDMSEVLGLVLHRKEKLLLVPKLVAVV
jgi:cytochrome P450